MMQVWCLGWIETTDFSNTKSRKLLFWHTKVHNDTSKLH